jgi:hypothetical protein
MPIVFTKTELDEFIIIFISKKLLLKIKKLVNKSSVTLSVASCIIK